VNRVKRLLERLRPHRTRLAVAGVVLVWAAAFRWGWAKSEWTSIWAEAPATQGQSISLAPHDVETTAEREKRETVKAQGLRDSYHSLKQDVLGDTRKTRGDAPSIRLRRRSGESQDLTPEEVCEQMKLSDPAKYGSLKCKDDDGDGY
jgi:hypothetical protein